jgi:hypothetical protein
MQRRLFEYGGERRLDELPHVLTAISEADQMPELIPRLRAEGELLANDAHARHEIFVLIDNFEEFSDEIARERTMLQELAGMARRYGRDGLHFIISTLPTTNKNDLQKRIQAANLGIGLRTVQALETFQVRRLPRSMNNGELPIGRGFVVKAGQPRMMQVATPYAENGTAPAIDPEDEADVMQQALDRWVHYLCEKYPGQRAEWASPPEPAAAAPATPQQSARAQRMLRVLRAGMHKEIAHLQEGNGAEGSLLATLLQHMDISGATDEATLAPYLKELLIKENRASSNLKMSRADAESMCDLMDTDTLLLQLESLLAKELQAEGQPE